jgi:hypothetical protein
VIGAVSLTTGFTQQRATQSLTIWFFACAAVTLFVASRRSELKRQLNTMDMHVVVLIAIAGLSFYATSVYPHVRRNWGGGTPISVEVELREAQNNSAGARLLIEETPDGFYFLVGHRDAQFVPRDMVRTVWYRSDRRRPDPPSPK